MDVSKHDRVTQTRRPKSTLSVGFRSSSSSTDLLRRLQTFYADRSTSDEDRTRCLQYVASLYQVTRKSTRNAPSVQSHQQASSPRAHSVPAAPDQPQVLNDSGTNEPIGSNTRRPHTSMATVGVVTRRYFPDPYETSYSRDFKASTCVPTESVRPSTNIPINIRMPQKLQELRSTYGDEYQLLNEDLSKSRVHPIYPLNGEKRNNPHPLKPFLVWRVPRSDAAFQREPIKDNTYELPECLINDKLKSTYQLDFIETPPHVIHGSRKSVRLTLDATPTTNFDSTTSRDFRQPSQPVAPQLLVPTTRYGSNVNKQKPAIGAVPGIPNGIYMKRCENTSYDFEFNGVSDVIAGKHQ